MKPVSDSHHPPNAPIGRMLPIGSEQPDAQPAKRVLFQRVYPSLSDLWDRLVHFFSRSDSKIQMASLGPVRESDLKEEPLPILYIKSAPAPRRAAGADMAALPLGSHIRARPAATDALGLPSGSDADRLKALLFGAAYETQRSKLLPVLEQTGLMESLRFFEAVQKFRENPTVDKAKFIQRHYIDACLPGQRLSGGKDSPAATDGAHKLNLSAQHKRHATATFERCLLRIDCGETEKEAHLGEVFHTIEAFVATQILRSLDSKPVSAGRPMEGH